MQDSGKIKAFLIHLPDGEVRESESIIKLPHKLECVENYAKAFILFPKYSGQQHLGDAKD